MSENDIELMKFYGITTELKTVYLYDNYKYDNLSDAVKYAKVIDNNSHSKNIIKYEKSS